MKKKIALLLVVSLFFSTMPMNVFGENTTRYLNYTIDMSVFSNQIQPEGGFQGKVSFGAADGNPLAEGTHFVEQTWTVPFLDGFLTINLTKDEELTENGEKSATITFQYSNLVGGTTFPNITTNGSLWFAPYSSLSTAPLGNYQGS